MEFTIVQIDSNLNESVLNLFIGSCKQMIFSVLHFLSLINYPLWSKLLEKLCYFDLNFLEDRSSPVLKQIQKKVFKCLFMITVFNAIS